MPRLRWPLLAAAMISAVLVLTACGSDDKNSENTPTGANTEASGAGDATPSGSDDKTPGATTTSGTNGNGTGTDELKDVAQKFATSSFKGTYTVTGGFGTGEDAITDGVLTLYKSGEDKFRFDIKGKQGGQDLEVLFIETPDVSAFCLKNAGELGALLGIEGTDGVCFKSATDNNPIAGFSETLTDIETGNVSVTETSTRTVAGQQADCYKTLDNTTQEVSTSCFNDAGAILYVSTEGADGSTLEATSVSSDVSDNDFVPPYEVRDDPGFFGG